MRKYVVIWDDGDITTGGIEKLQDILTESAYGYEDSQPAKIYTMTEFDLAEVKVNAIIRMREVDQDDWIHQPYTVTLDGIQIDTFTTRVDGRA